MSETGTDAKLIRMANQIATFFASQPEAERVDGVAAHINKFWEPRMRRRFHELVDGGAEGFLPLVIAAATKIRRPEPVAAAT
jgi:formate dehydrogenase subunit delta